MKIVLSILLFILSFGSVFAAEETQGKIDILYKDYTDNVKNFCTSDKQPWSNGRTVNSLITKDRVIYASINNQASGDAWYKEYLNLFFPNKRGYESEGLIFGKSFLQKASNVYKETMNAMYVCAVINTKVRIIDNLLSKIPTTQSNTKKKYEQQLENLRKSLEKKGCRGIKETSELSLKKAILDNTTAEYCNYRYYLNYLNQASKESINDFFGTGSANRNNITSLPGTSKFIQNKKTEYMVQEINRVSNEITAEINHTKEIFPQAMVAFSEFDKTYASHVLLEFILQDYVDLRVSLKKLLNPIGQVIYKASNAQAPMN